MPRQWFSEHVVQLMRFNHFRLGRAFVAVGTTALAAAIVSNCFAQTPVNKSSAAAPKGRLTSAQESRRSEDDTNMQSVIAHTMRPFTGVSHPAVDTSTMTGKVMCGYQGWFTAEGDGAERGWTHWRGTTVSSLEIVPFDFWPDVSELDPDERYETAFRHADGSSAQVFLAHSMKRRSCAPFSMDEKLRD